MTASAAPLAYVRVCPNCGSERPVGEMVCEASPGGAGCGWSLADAAIRVAGMANPQPPAAESPPLAVRHCTNGHALDAGDEMCHVCGADPAPAEVDPVTPRDNAPAEGPPPTIIDGWVAEQRLPPAAGDEPWERLVVSRASAARRALLTLYQPGFEPDPAVHDVLRHMPRDHIPELIATGRYEGRAYEVAEFIEGGTLADAGWCQDFEHLRSLIDELGRALASFAEMGLRHRDLRPSTILLRTRSPLDLVITGFGSARLSDYDLEAVAPLELTRYSAPEAIVGAVSAASDWWSLGMLVLEQATQGQCFTGVDDLAFRLHVVTRGVSLPDNISGEIRVLLRGLLARDPLRRWGADEVRRWLAGETVAAAEEVASAEQAGGPPITLGSRTFTRPDLFALAAAEKGCWEEARDLVLRGSVATWLAARGDDQRRQADVRRLTSDESLPEDQRLALALLALNPALPFTVAGEIVTPAWLLANPNAAYAIVTGEAARHLERMGREPWLVRLAARAAAVRERAKLLEVELDESRLRVALLATSRANLDAERSIARRLYPDTDHPGLSALMERQRLSDEDLIILVSAGFHQFVPLASLTDAALQTAAQAGIQIEPDALTDLLVRPRREIFQDVEQRTANFARCRNERVDGWADTFRVERRLSLDRAATLLAVPASAWQEPPHQQYVATLLELFEKRVSGAVGRGVLARFNLGKTTPRLDLTELGTALRPGEALLNHVLSKVELASDIDAAAYLDDPARESRLRRLVSHAQTFRRDTGIDGRYLGFPFLMIGTGTTTKARVAPVLLWPIAIEMQSGSARTATVMFDPQREEVRLNPALESVLGSEAFGRWGTARDELLARASFRLADVMDVFGSLATPSGRSLAPLPSKDARAPTGRQTLLPSAAIFNAEFTGQSVAEDLRQMRRRPPYGTALEAALRIASAPPDASQTPAAPELDRYVTVESDPSQDLAVLRARTAPGLLIEGPPGTGKSQTIVNIIADALGRGETVLVICQKQAALRVVEKRLQAEGLDNRLFRVSDINRDRTGIINALREQVPGVRTQPPGRVASIRRARAEKAARIEVLEQEIDRHHHALHEVDDATTLSYRDLIGELIGLEAEGAILEVPALRAILGRLDRGATARLEQTCAPLARLWLESEFENSPLQVLQQFAVDETIAEEFHQDLSRLIGAERARSEVLDGVKPQFRFTEADTHVRWMDVAASELMQLPEDVRPQLAKWAALFCPPGTDTTPGMTLIAELEAVQGAVEQLRADYHRAALFDRLVALPEAELKRHASDAQAVLTRATSVLQHLSLSRWRRRRAVRSLLTAWGQSFDDRTLGHLRDASELEQALRPLRARIDAVSRSLDITPGIEAAPREDLLRHVRQLLGTLRPVAAVAERVRSCPRHSECLAAVQAGTLGAIEDFLCHYRRAIARSNAQAASSAALAGLERWFDGAWLKTAVARLEREETLADLLVGVVSGLGNLAAYQRFRSRAAGLDAEALNILARFRPLVPALKQHPPFEWEGLLQRTMRREALRAWKSRIEAAWPELAFEREELERKIAVLGQLDAEQRGLNRQLLGADLDSNGLGSQAQWDAITRLSGPRALRLREILDQGTDLGLMRLRPIWLMSPDIASRMLPLKAGLFDLVVFDEASQMPVEHAVPTLFRARRAVISGDEKQMPPSSFFASKMDGDGDDDSDPENLEDVSDAERAAQEESWNRRDVQSCPDLLQLGRSVLPNAMLQIHYRSAYRELIGFSNGAFYRNSLNVPARHPDDEVRRARPIDVVRVDGVYHNKTNAAEAAAAVETLAALWAVASEKRPSIGIVSFNRDQADLIEAAIETRAAADPDFLSALQRERDRQQNGEDMGFFVKNVENVQGDERDIIIFSTTFGRDTKGAFSRNFGVLGQTGGERRLNVAVTRARTKVVLLTSMPIKDVSDWLAAGRLPAKPRDYLQAYLDYASKVSNGDIQAARMGQARLGKEVQRAWNDGEPQDGFTASIAAFIRELGYEPVAARDADAFRLDFAIENPRTGLFAIGIECDAPRHPLLSRARAREIWRPSVLRRSVPRLHRVSSSAWYNRGDEERARLRAAVQAALAEGEAA
jgi:primosomal replication protein N''